MVELDFKRAATLRAWFPDRPGPCAGLHVLNTGLGTIWADSRTQPRVLLARAGSDYSLVGDAAAVSPADLRAVIAGFVDAVAEFAPLLQAAFSELATWSRLIYRLDSAPQPAAPAVAVRRLGRRDAGAVEGLDGEDLWIAKTWGGAARLAGSGYCWGAFVDGRLASVACTFHLGDHFEEIGVVTGKQYRGRGLSGACAGALCNDIVARGRRPSWSTSPDNDASRRVALKLGFTLQRHDTLYVAGVPVP